MSSRALAAVAVVFLGMLSFLFSVNLVQSLITMPYYPEEIEGKTSLVVLAYILPLVVLVGAGLFLILRRHQIADWIVSGSPVEETTESRNLAGLPALLFAALGIYLVVTTLPTIAGLASRLIFSRSYSNVEEFAGVFWSNLGYYAGTLGQLVIGAYLFFGARKLEHWWFSPDTVEPKTVPMPPDLPTCPQCGTQFDPADYRSDLQEKLCSKCRAALPESEFENA
jgi:hypothetical protein